MSRAILLEYAAFKAQVRTSYYGLNNLSACGVDIYGIFDRLVLLSLL